MKKAILASAIGLALVGGQALAQNTGGATRVADRVGAQAGETSELAGGIPAGLIFAAATVVSFYVVSQINDDDDSESD